MKTDEKRKSDLRFAFFGTPALAVLFLDELERAGFIPCIVVTTPDMPQKRGLAVAPPPVKAWAGERDIPVLQPERIDESVIAALREQKLDVGVVIYYGKIIPKAAIDLFPHGILNVHFSLLPRWRGTSPVRAAIVAGDTEFGTSIIALDEKIDHGPIVAQKKITMPSVPPSAKELERVSTIESAKLLAGIVPSWVAGEIDAREQYHDAATHCPNYEKSDGELNLAGDPQHNLLKIRGLDSTVGTYSFFERDGKKIRAQILDAHLDGNKLVIDTVKPEGKREMRYEEFLRSGASLAR